MQSTCVSTTGQKRRRDGRAPPCFWPPLAIPSLDATLPLYVWPHGPEQLVQERRTVKSILETAHELRMPVLQWPSLAVSRSYCGIGFLGMSLSVDEVFVDSTAKRNMLVDRAHQCFNTTWKLEVQALTCNAGDGLDDAAREQQRFANYEMTKDHLYLTVDKIDGLRGLYGSLRPETVALLACCGSTNEVRRSMVMSTEPCVFLEGFTSF